MASSPVNQNIMKWSTIFVVICLFDWSNGQLSFGSSFRMKPQTSVWEVDDDHIDQLLNQPESSSDLSGREHFAQKDEDNYDTGVPFREDDEDIGLCVDPIYCANRDGEGLIEPRKNHCAKPKVFCPLDELEDYPLCGISKSNLIRDRILSADNSKSSFGEWPWVAIVMEHRGNDDYYLCNGVLIDSQHVITVAHCFDNPEIEDKEINDIVIRLGEHDINNKNEPLPALDIEGELIVMHPNFTRANLYNDIAVIRLKHKVPETDHIGPICMPNPIEVRKFQTAPNSVHCITTGWGSTSKGKKGSYADVAKKVTLPLVDRNQCEHLLRKTKLGKRFELHSSFLCAGGEEGSDSCFGDGGSPLMCQQDDGTFTLVGLVSWGIGCGKGNVPGVYTNVAEFIDFIDDCKIFMHKLKIHNSAKLN